MLEVFVFRKLFMRGWYLSIGVLLSSSVLANGVEFPVRCDEQILTPTVSALCKEHRSVTLEAEEKYLYALSQVKSVRAWQSLKGVQAEFMASYYMCAIKGEARAVAVCLTPAFQNLLSQLPHTINEHPSDLKKEAHKANLLVLSHAYTEFTDCTAARIASLDDGISSARDIALGVGTFCRPQASVVAEIRLNASTTFIAEIGEIKDQMNLATKLSNPDELVGSVLEYRAQKRTKVQQQNKRTSPARVES
ncbi:MAG: hypothetical protein EOP06_00790 [Proteobacteria bacterium]|jgi:hypothetical protein|nr:MAG: hypothetical protein EOP06_00790 [Pseudomonadota bacterium]